jgi:hypothetical protein
MDVSGSTVLSGEDPRWNALLRDKSVLLLRTTDLTQMILSRLLYNNGSTGNFRVLLNATLARLRGVQQLAMSNQVAERARGNIAQCCVALHLSAIFIHNLSAHCTCDDLLAHCGDDCIPMFISLLDESGKVLNPSAVQITHPSFETQNAIYNHDKAFYCANLIISMMSSQLYHTSQEPRSSPSPSNDKILFFHIINSWEGDLSVILSNIVHGSIHRFVHKTTVSSSSIIAGIVIGSRESASDNTSIVSSLLSRALWTPVRLIQGVTSVFTGAIAMQSTSASSSGTMAPSDESNQKGSSSPLGDRCVALLNIILHSAKSNINCKNIVFRAFNSICSSNDAEEIEIGAQLKFDLDSFISSMVRHVPNPTTTLLLYSVLQSLPVFGSRQSDNQASIIIRIEPILVRLLHGIYDEHLRCSIQHHYLLSVCLLLMLQNESILPLLSHCHTVLPWYKERNFRDKNSSVSLTDAIILCVLRAMMPVILYLHDPYLASNYFAILLNLAPHLSHIQAYTAERLIGVTCKLAKRLSVSMKTEESLGKVGTPLMEEGLRMLYKTISISVKRDPKLGTNLKYVMAHDVHEIETAFSDLYISKLCQEDAGSDSITPLELISLSKYYLSLISGTSDDDCSHQGDIYYTARQAKAALKKGLAMTGNGVESFDNQNAHQFVVYSYEEGDTSNAFFIPFAWMGLLLVSPDMDWLKDRIQLIDRVNLEIIRQNGNEKSKSEKDEGKGNIPLNVENKSDVNNLDNSDSLV